MEHRERGEPLGLSNLLLVYHDFLLALSRRTERLIQDFNAFIQCFNGRWMAAGCHNYAASVKRLRYEKTRRSGSFRVIEHCPMRYFLRCISLLECAVCVDIEIIFP